MIQSGMTIDKEVKIMGQIGAKEGITRAYLGKQQQIDNKIKSLTEAIKEQRQQMASKQGCRRMNSSN